MAQRRRITFAVGWATVLLLLVLVGAGWLTGVRAHYLTTPSMGTALPVGSLVVTSPAEVEDIAVGDVVTTALSGGGSRTHRVIEVQEGGLLTQGDLNGAADAGLTTDRNLVGEVTWSARGLGWVVQMAPWILGMWLSLWVVSRPLGDPVQRSRYRVVGLYLGFSLSIIVVQPLLGMNVLGIDVEGGGEDSRATATAVSTGLLPIKLVPSGDGGVESEIMARTGETGEAIVLAPNDRGEFVFRPTPVLTWPAVLAALGLVISPWIWFFLQYRRNREIEMPEEETQPQQEGADLR